MTKHNSENCCWLNDLVDFFGFWFWFGISDSPRVEFVHGRSTAFPWESLWRSAGIRAAFPFPPSSKPVRTHQPRHYPPLRARRAPISGAKCPDWTSTVGSLMRSGAWSCWCCRPRSAEIHKPSVDVAAVPDLHEEQKTIQSMNGNKPVE